jgi:multidrug resistance efflux pump
MTAHIPHNGLNPAHSPFRVVPPTQVAPPLKAPQPEAPDLQTEPEDAEVIQAEDRDTTAPKLNRRWVILGIAIAGLTGAAFIPTPYQVGGSVQLDWKESARQSVRTPIPAIVTQVVVKTGDTVQPGQVLAQLSSRELDQQIAEVEEKLARSGQELQSLEQEKNRAQANLLELAAKQQVTQERADRISARAAQQGRSAPEVQALIVEQQRLRGQLQESEIQVQRYQALYDQGAIALMNLEERQTQYRNVERDLAAKTEQVEYAKQQLSDSAQDEEASALVQNVSVNAATMIAGSTQQITAYQETLTTLEKRRQELLRSKAGLTLKATTSGTVITSDLDLLVGQEIRPDMALLQIANLHQLTANVQVKEEDLDYVQSGASVTFRPNQAKLNPYAARVEDVLYNVQTDDTKQQRVATVRVVIENPDGRLRPGSSGYARIFSEWIPLYQRVGREVLKLVPERFL